jgi:hypothetical protein
MDIKTGRFRLNDLTLVGKAPEPDYPPLKIGNFCRLNSGSIPLLVVDVEDDDLALAYKDNKGRVTEFVINHACVRRA